MAFVAPVVRTLHYFDVENFHGYVLSIEIMQFRIFGISVAIVENYFL